MPFKKKSNTVFIKMLHTIVIKLKSHLDFVLGNDLLYLDFTMYMFFFSNLHNLRYYS